MSEIHTPQELDPAAAFEAMGQRLAGLTAAIDGLAVKFQEMHARDYSPELAKIEGQFQAVRLTVKQFRERPVMALTPETVAAQIEAAGRDGRLADHQAWERARSDLQVAAASIDRVVAKARTGQKQTKRDALVASVMLVIGVLMGGVGRDFIPWMAPMSWHWPEERAAAILGGDKWAAGERLLEVADPERWLKVKVAAGRFEDKSVEAGKLANRKADCVPHADAKKQRSRASD